MEGEGTNGLILGQQNQSQDQKLQPPQKCPRCDSPNTKFSYFNNYSHSQPRYFCMTCRRYWTHGGNLRNVPIGSGCRKGKRARMASSSKEAVILLPAIPIASAPQPLAPAPLHPAQLHPNLTSAPPNVVPPNPVLGKIESGPMVPTFAMPPPIKPYYPGPAVDDGGYLTSFLSNNKSLSMGGGDAQGTSNFSSMPGFNVQPFSYQQQQQPQIPSQQFYQMGNRERNIGPMYQRQPGLTQSGMPACGSGYQTYWPQNFMNRANRAGSVSDASVWNLVNTTSMNANPHRSSAAGSLVPNHWPRIPE